MRRAALSGIAVAFAALSVALAVAGGGAAARRPTLAGAVGRTAQAGSERYAIHVVMTNAGTPLSLHIRGQASRHAISVRMRVGSVRLPDGTRIPGPDGAALLDGPFLYERAPSGVVLYGTIHWLRMDVPRLSPASPDLKAVHELTPAPLLDVLRAARIAPVRAGERSFHGTIAYDDPAMRSGLAKLTGGLEFRGLRVWAAVGADGLVHRVVITGRTADGRTTFALRARLFDFGRGVHVTPPAPGTFLDENDQLTA